MVLHLLTEQKGGKGEEKGEENEKDWNGTSGYLVRPLLPFYYIVGHHILWPLRSPDATNIVPFHQKGKGVTHA